MAGVIAILLTLLLPLPPQEARPAELPVSLDRIREGLAAPGIFEIQTPRRPPGRPLFRVKIEQPLFSLESAWDETSLTSPWVRPSLPPAHFEFLSSVTPEEVRSSTVHPCCDVLPLVSALQSAVSKQIRGFKKRRAKREVERVMEAAGIKR